MGTIAVAQEFQKVSLHNALIASPSADRPKQTVDLTPLKSLGVDAKQEDIQWVMPIIYSNVLPDPLKYDKSGPKEGIIGILALGIVQLPEYGDSGEVEIESGSAAFFSSLILLCIDHVEDREASCFILASRN